MLGGSSYIDYFFCFVKYELIVQVHPHVVVCFAPQSINSTCYLCLLIMFCGPRSVQDELKRESNADALTVAISYIVMLFYVAAALSWRTCSSPGQVFVNSRVLLALSGVLIVLAAVVGSLGICSLLGVKATLIIMEVIPFLVLAVGVDNMFILTQGLQKQVRIYHTLLLLLITVL